MNEWYARIHVSSSKLLWSCQFIWPYMIMIVYGLVIEIGEWLSRTFATHKWQRFDAILGLHMERKKGIQAGIFYRTLDHLSIFPEPFSHMPTLKWISPHNTLHISIAVKPFVGLVYSRGTYARHGIRRQSKGYQNLNHAGTRWFWVSKWGGMSGYDRL